MNVERDEQAEALSRTVNDRAMSRRLAFVGWGLFLVWIGIAKVADLPPGAVLLGVGVVTLAIQGARAYFALPLEGFWVVAGAIFAASGLVKLVGSEVRFLPLLTVAAGAVLVFLGLRGQGKKKNESPPA